MDKLITVFTPTYNRKQCIYKCYQSLCNQSSFNFEWLVIDDGSNDDTESLIKQWQREQKNFVIRYFWKNNGGLHSAYNKGIKLAQTELFVCIDSDDWMPEDAIEKIETIWKKINNKKYAGIMGIDCYQNGICVGDKFPEDIQEMYLYEKMTKYHLNGDKKMIHRTAWLKEVAPMPSFQDEKYFNPSYMMYQLDKFGKLYVVNECFCIVDYQPDGMSSNIYKQYRNSPNSFAETRKLYLSFPNTTVRFKMRQSIHYVSSCQLARKFFNGIKESPCLFYFIIAIVPGTLLTSYVLLRTRKMYNL
ncbi:MAG: glycosyltransferase family 2 protein [Blautia sp.]|uniref:glycosyltransferase family 2 protein n=1 Tax=Blautia sp. TaxID=1955243 RepID=UPI002588F05E|nr:glycosyltransferase family A protein [Blautia sp.]MCI7289261.1 glycosyltransferase family 2 protein [Blautia sp.]